MGERGAGQDSRMAKDCGTGREQKQNMTEIRRDRNRTGTRQKQTIWDKEQKGILQIDGDRRRTPDSLENADRTDEKGEEKKGASA